MYKTLIVIENDAVEPSLAMPGVISFEQYLHDYPKQNEARTRIINLCNSAAYLSKGYYCSLLAEARRHEVLPSVRTINELKRHPADISELKRFLLGEQDLTEQLNDSELFIYFGKVDDSRLRKLAARLFQKYPAPILRLRIEMESGLLELEQYSYSMLNTLQQQAFQQALEEFTSTVWRIGKRKKAWRWDMAILVNPEEKEPPSNRQALSRFVKAAEKHGIHAEVLSIDQIYNIEMYDALFIRETTAIDHYTYRLARRAEDAGLVVFDDPDSILRCCNKIYLQDAFTYSGVPGVRSEVVSQNGPETWQLLEQAFGYPMVLKMPEGSFSRGVFKVNNRDELASRLNELFVESALVLVQEYLYTDYDWRIGVMNGRAIFACRYLMAKNHWQIYNHASTRYSSGGFETLPTFEVPRLVLDAAIKAAHTVGDGLYGVDIKELNGKAYVLEVNDNPSIEHRVEDVYLGDELYMQIMGEFQRRLEARGR